MYLEFSLQHINCMEPTLTSTPAWIDTAVFYHIYPLGFCGAERTNDFISPVNPRLKQINGWIEHFLSIGVDALYLGPVFESTAHGYDTVDYFRVDRRLGTDETLSTLIDHLHANGIRVILDGVFHHVGRDFPGFRDLQENGEGSAYRDWFAGVDFGGRSPYGDPFSYDGWRGHYDLVKLNLSNPDVRAHLFGAVSKWIETYQIDGLRLDVAGEIDPAFLRDLAAFCRSTTKDFWLLGEVIHGDYRQWANPGMLDSATNYEVYKGLYSSHNDRNYFEIAHSLDRQFGPRGMYRHLRLYNFADNHDVNRIASTLHNPAHLLPLYLLLFTIPGVPSVYAGSEWGLEGVKLPDDDSPLRPALRLPDAPNAAPYPWLAQQIGHLATLRKQHAALHSGDFRSLYVSHEQIAFSRKAGDEEILVLVNAASEPIRMEIPLEAGGEGAYTDLLDPAFTCQARGGLLDVDAVPAFGGRILRNS